jgi:hypothetical protein
MTDPASGGRTWHRSKESFRLVLLPALGGAKYGRIPVSTVFGWNPAGVWRLTKPLPLLKGNVVVEIVLHFFYRRRRRLFDSLQLDDDERVLERDRQQHLYGRDYKSVVAQ